MRPVGIIEVEALDGIGGSRRHLGICDDRRGVIMHFNDAFRIAIDFARIEGTHTNGDFNRRHFRPLRCFLDFNQLSVDPRMILLSKRSLIVVQHATTCKGKAKKIRLKSKG